MSEIQAGDYVIINGKGPYLVEATRPDWLWIMAGDKGGSSYVRREWCVKVRALFRPEPGTVWRDNEANIWQCVRLTTGVFMYRLVDNYKQTLEVAASQYGPMVQLVPKEQA